MNKHGRSLGETKTHFKMYKKGRNWMVAGVAMTSFGLSVVGFGTQTAKADTATTDADSTAVSTTATDDHAIVLKADSTSRTKSTGTSQAVPTSAATDQTQDTTVTPTTDTTAGTDTTTTKATASDDAVTDTTPNTTTTTANNGTEKATSATHTTTGDNTDPTASTSDAVETLTSIKDNETVTNLKTSSDATFEAAKKVANENYKTLGTAQKIVRTADSVIYTLANGESAATGTDFTINATATGTDIADGTFGTSQWRVTDDKVLHIGAGELGSSHGTLIGPKAAYYSSTSNWTPFQDDIRTIDIEKGVIAPVDASYLFATLSHVISINGLENLDTSKTQNFSRMFADINDLSALDASKLNISAATDLSGMFADDVNLSSTHTEDWDVSKVTNFTSMFYGAGMQSLDLSKWNTSSGQLYSSMFYRMPNLARITFGSGFTITPDMPTVLNRDSDNNVTYISDWVGQGTGTIQNPQGHHFLDTTYSGNPADADTYFLNAMDTFTFEYRDLTTGAVVKVDSFTGKVGVEETYKVDIPGGYIGTFNNPESGEIPYMFSVDGSEVYEIGVAPTIEVPYSQTYQSSVTKDDGTIVAKTSGRTSYDLVLDKPSTSAGITASKIEAVKATVYENEVARNASITDSIPDGYELSAVSISVIGSTGSGSETSYNYRTQAATATMTNIDPVTGEKTVTDLAQFAEPQGTTFADEIKLMFDARLKWNGNQVTMNFDKLTSNYLPNAVESIAYTISPTAQTRTVTYINQLDDTQVSSDTINGVTDESGTYTVIAPAGYVLAPGQATSIAYTLTVDNTTPIEVAVIPAITGTDTTGDNVADPAVTPTTTPTQVVTTPTQVVTTPTSMSEANDNVTLTTAEPRAVVTDKNAGQAMANNVEKPAATTDTGQTIASVATISTSSANAAAVSTDRQTVDAKVTTPSASVKLPQTSETTSAIGALIGAVLLSAASLLGFEVKKQRRN